jgi:hypothetical protein
MSIGPIFAISSIDSPANGVRGSLLRLGGRPAVSGSTGLLLVGLELTDE